MPLSNKCRISAAAMSEIETALKSYYTAVEASDLSQSSQATYIDMANRFVRWLRREFDPGSRKAPYRVVIDRPTPQRFNKDGSDA